MRSVQGRVADDPGRAGRDGGFEEFFERHYRDLFRALWLVTRDSHEAEEIAQEAFLRVWERWPRVAGRPGRDGYLYRTAMNVFRSRRRRVAVAMRRAIRVAPGRDELGAVEARDAVARALAGLTARQRAAVVALDLLDMTSEEAGRALGIRPSTVRVLASRGRDALRKELRIE